MRFDTLKTETPKENIDKFGFLKDNPTAAAAVDQPKNLYKDTAFVVSADMGLVLSDPVLAKEYQKGTMEGLDYMNKVQKATGNALYYAENKRSEKYGFKITPKEFQKPIKFNSMEDALRKGWSGEARTPTTDWMTGLVMDPKSIEWAKDQMPAWTKTPMAIQDLVNELAVSYIAGYGVTKVERAGNIFKDFYTLGKIKTDKSFVQNVASAVKQTVQTPKGMPDSDIYLLKMYEKTGVKPPGGLEAIRPDVEGVKRWTEESQNLKDNRTMADEIYAGSIIEKSHVDNIPEPEHIGDQRFVVESPKITVSDKVIKGAGKRKPVTVEKILRGEHPVMEEAQFENVIKPKGRDISTPKSKTATYATDDNIYNHAVDLVTSEGKVSTAILQRRIGVTRAMAKDIIAKLESDGIIGSADKQGRRTVIGNKIPSVENVIKTEQNATATVGRKDVTSLQSLGYSDIQIRKMIPTEAQRVVDNNIRAEKVTVLNDGTVAIVNAGAANISQPVELSFNKNAGFIIENSDGMGHDKLRLIDDSVVDLTFNSTNVGFNGNVMVAGSGFVDANIIKSVIRENGTEVPFINNYKQQIKDINKLGEHPTLTDIMKIIDEPKIPSGGEKEAQDALDYMAHEINEKKVDEHINDTQATVVKQSKDTLEQVRIQLDLDIANADRNAKLAQQGRLFLTPEVEQRAIKEEYLRAYISAWEKDIDPRTMPKQEKGLLGEIASNRANMPNKDFGKMIEDITHQISNGRTKDISALSSDEFSSIFDMVDSMTSIRSAIKQMNSAGIMELFNPSWDYFTRMKAAGVYNIPNEAGMELTRKTHSLLSDWAGYMKAAGIKTHKKMDHYGIPDANEVIARHPIGDKLRRIFLYADGINPYDPIKSMRKIGPDEQLTIDEIKFIEETMDNVESGKISQIQIDAEVNAAEFIRRSMEFFGDMGERLQFLYKPGTAKELRPEGSVVRMPNYMRHQITQILDEIKNSKSAYVLDYVKKFFKHNVKEEINIDELIQRHNQRKGMVQNADVAFRSVIGHEGFKFYMEPAFKSASKLSNDIDIMRGIPIAADQSVSTYTAGWINTAFRGQMTNVEGKIERIIGGVKNAELATYHGLGKTVNTIRKMLKRDALEFNWEPTKYDRAFKTFSGRYRQYVYTAAMGLNPTSILKGATQTFLVHPLIGTRATLEGLKSVWVGGKDTLKHSDVFFARGIAIHELEVSAINRVVQTVLLPFRFIDQYVNCASAFNGSLFKQIYKDKSKLAILNNYGYAGKSTGDSFWKSLNKAIDAGEFRGEVKIADMITKRTQFSYLPWDMPKALWGPVGKLGMQFGSWSMNYWTQYLPYLWSMSRTGVGPFGQLSKWERQSLLKHVITMEALAMTGEWAGIDISYVSPTHAIAKGAIGTAGVLSGNKPTGETYQQGPFPSLPPALGSINLLAAEYNMATSGRASKLQQIIAPVKSALMMDPYAKPSDWAGYLPGSLPKTIVKVARGKKSPLAFVGVNLTKERKVGGR
jgi:ribosomal protein S25